MARKKLTVKAKTYERGAWTDRYGHRHPATTVTRSSYKVEDKGKLGRTPKGERWYEHETVTGWKKNMPTAQRRRLVLKAHKRNYLSSARAMQALVNVTTDKRTRQLAQADANYFFREYARRKKK